MRVCMLGCTIVPRGMPGVVVRMIVGIDGLVTPDRVGLNVVGGAEVRLDLGVDDGGAGVDAADEISPGDAGGTADPGAADPGSADSVDSLVLDVVLETSDGLVTDGVVTVEVAAAGGGGGILLDELSSPRANIAAAATPPITTTAAAAAGRRQSRLRATWRRGVTSQRVPSAATTYSLVPRDVVTRARISRLGSLRACRATAAITTFSGRAPVRTGISTPATVGGVPSRSSTMARGVVGTPCGSKSAACQLAAGTGPGRCPDAELLGAIGQTFPITPRPCPVRSLPCWVGP